MIDIRVVWEQFFHCPRRTFVFYFVNVLVFSRRKILHNTPWFRYIWVKKTIFIALLPKYVQCYFLLQNFILNQNISLFVNYWKISIDDSNLFVLKYILSLTFFTFSLWSPELQVHSVDDSIYKQPRSDEKQW